MVRNRNKTPHHPLLLPRLNFSPSFSTLLSPTLSPQVMQGNGKGRLQSVLNSSSLQLLLPHAAPLLQHGIIPARYSPARTAPVWVFPVGCTPSFRNRLLQGESPRRPQFLTGNLLLHGTNLLSMDHSSSQGSALV